MSWTRAQNSCHETRRIPGPVATLAAHDQHGRSLVQTFAPLFEPLPRMPQRRAQRAGFGLLLARRRIDASVRSFMNRSTPQLTFNGNAGQSPCIPHRCSRKPRVLHCGRTKNRRQVSTIPVETFSYLSTLTSRKIRKRSFGSKEIASFGYGLHVPDYSGSSCWRRFSNK